MQKNTSFINHRRLLRWAGVAMAVVGSLDIAAAILKALINGTSPMVMLAFIASGVFGKSAFTGDAIFAFYGVVFHYCIAGIWTMLFFIIYPKFREVTKNKATAAIAYGMFVNFIMTTIVLPLSNAPSLSLTLSGFIISSLIVIAVVGFPLIFIADNFYRKLN